MGDAELRRLVAENIVERVEEDRDTALQELDTARRHLESARTIAGGDPSGAFAMAYDAMRTLPLPSARDSSVTNAGSTASTMRSASLASSGAPLRSSR